MMTKTVQSMMNEEEDLGEKKSQDQLELIQSESFFVHLQLGSFVEHLQSTTMMMMKKKMREERRQYRRLRLPSQRRFHQSLLQMIRLQVQHLITWLASF